MLRSRDRPAQRVPARMGIVRGSARFIRKSLCCFPLHSRKGQTYWTSCRSARHRLVSRPSFVRSLRKPTPQECQLLLLSPYQTTIDRWETWLHLQHASSSSLWHMFPSWKVRRRVYSSRACLWTCTNAFSFGIRQEGRKRTLNTNLKLWSSFRVPRQLGGMCQSYLRRDSPNDWLLAWRSGLEVLLPVRSRCDIL